MSEILSKSQSGVYDPPIWWDGKKLNEIEFCTWFLERHELMYVGNAFYDIDGFLPEEKLSKEILEAIESYVKTNLSNRINKIKDVLRLKCMSEHLPAQEDRVHFANGTYYLDGGFIPEKQFCANRLPVMYNPKALVPVKWLEFLEQLLYPEDIVTLQEFMGYCMIPTTKAQTMLMLIGNGGEGKSRVGLVMRSILGDNMNICSISKLSKDRFCRADQEGKLLMIDDDMQMEALSDTNILKAIITMEDKMDLERKGKQSTQGFLYVRLMAFGNGTLTSLYDKSEGFYRRQIVIMVKDKDPDRKDDRNLAEKLKEEKEGIVLWCRDGLKRLAGKGFHFTVSDRTKKTLEDTKRDDDNLIEFFDSDGYVHYQEDAEMPVKELYDIYLAWCEDNLEKPRVMNSFSKYLKGNAQKLGLEYKKNIPMPGGRFARGYKGICRHPGENPFEKRML